MTMLSPGSMPATTTPPLDDTGTAPSPGMSTATGVAPAARATAAGTPDARRRRRRLGAGAPPDAEPLDLAGEEAPDEPDVLVVRKLLGDADLAADLVGLLEHGHVVAPRRGHPGRLQPGGAAAHHDHPPGLASRGQRPPLVLAAGGRVHRAGDGLAVGDERPAVIAGDAEAGPGGP